LEYEYSKGLLRKNGHPMDKRNVHPMGNWTNNDLQNTTQKTKERTLCPVKGCKFSAVEKINVKNHVFNMHTNKVKH
jgi:hypothetical protein